MKRLMSVLFAAVLFLGLDVHAAAGVEAKGHTLYKMPTGELVNREVSLFVPAKGQGKVLLKFQGGEIEAKSFSTREARGRTVFYVQFEDVPLAPKGTDMLFKGTYLRGTNEAVYYGDIFGRNKSAGQKKWGYAGGFYFSAPVTKSANELAE